MATPIFVTAASIAAANAAGIVMAMTGMRHFNH